MPPVVTITVLARRPPPPPPHCITITTTTAKTAPHITDLRFRWRWNPWMVLPPLLLNYRRLLPSSANRTARPSHCKCPSATQRHYGSRPQRDNDRSSTTLAPDPNERHHRRNRTRTRRCWHRRRRRPPYRRSWGMNRGCCCHCPTRMETRRPTSSFLVLLLLLPGQMLRHRVECYGTWDVGAVSETHHLSTAVAQKQQPPTCMSSSRSARGKRPHLRPPPRTQQHLSN